MTLTVEAMRLMSAKGLSLDDVIEIAAAMQPTRTSGAARQKRYRDKIRNESDVTRDVTPPLNEEYSNPPELSPDASHPPRVARAPIAFPKPVWADDQVWRDFLANRKRKGLTNTATAHRKLLADIDRLTDPQWPPGRILEAATARGWGAIYPSIKEEQDSGNGRNTGVGMGGNRGASASGRGSTVDAAQRFIARHSSAAGQPV